MTYLDHGYDEEKGIEHLELDDLVKAALFTFFLTVAYMQEKRTKSRKNMLEKRTERGII